MAAVDLASDADARRTSPIELFWDLVFVFAITQVTTLLTRELTWAGAGRALLVLALVWWAWSAFVWAVNAQGEEALGTRLTLLGASVLIFIAGLAIPGAFTTHATLFAASYIGVRALHLVLYADASRHGAASWRSISGFAVTVLIGMCLLLAGSFASSGAQVALWTAAVAIDYAGPAWITRDRLRGLQHVAVAHFAERYGLFVLICLGESIVAVGVGANGHALDAARLAAVALALLVTIGLWWVYFARAAGEAEAHLRAHDDPVIAAADAYSYLHLVIVAGIIVFAVGARLATRDASAPLPDGARLALCGGVAIYLTGHAAFRLRIGAGVRAGELVAAAAALCVYAAAGASAWVVTGLLAAVLGVLVGVEVARARPARMLR